MPVYFGITAEIFPTCFSLALSDGTMKRADEYDTTFYTKIDPQAAGADANSIYPYGQLAESELAGYSLYAAGTNPQTASATASQTKSESRASSCQAPGSLAGSNAGRFHALGSLDCLEAAAAGAREKEVRSSDRRATSDDRRGSRDEKNPTAPPGGLEPPPATLVARKGRHNAGYSLRSPYLASSFVWRYGALAYLNFCVC